MVDFSALGDVSAEVLSLHCQHVSMNFLLSLLNIELHSRKKNTK